MTRVFVIMGGDYPDAVFASFQAATDYCEQQKQKHDDGTRKINWRVYSFDLQGTALRARSGEGEVLRGSPRDHSGEHGQGGP